MDIDDIPQEGNRALGGARKALYARAASGRIVPVPSAGWEVEEIVTLQVVEQFESLALESRRRVRAGLVSPLEYWMHARRMDATLLAQSTGFWRWRVRRHFIPSVFAKLPQRTLERYALALGITVEALRSVSREEPGSRP